MTHRPRIEWVDDGESFTAELGAFSAVLHTDGDEWSWTVGDLDEDEPYAEGVRQAFDNARTDAELTLRLVVLGPSALDEVLERACSRIELDTWTAFVAQNADMYDWYVVNLDEPLSDGAVWCIGGSSDPILAHIAMTAALFSALEHDLTTINHDSLDDEGR